MLDGVEEGSRVRQRGGKRKEQAGEGEKPAEKQPDRVKDRDRRIVLFSGAAAAAARIWTRGDRS